MNGSRTTEADGWVSEWRLHGSCIRMLSVRKRSGVETLLACSLAHAPDLVEVRERFPGLAALWDEVHNHFWSTYRPPAEGVAATSGRQAR